MNFGKIASMLSNENPNQLISLYDFLRIQRLKQIYFEYKRLN